MRKLKLARIPIWLRQVCYKSGYAKTVCVEQNLVEALKHKLPRKGIPAQLLFFGGGHKDYNTRYMAIHRPQPSKQRWKASHLII